MAYTAGTAYKYQYLNVKKQVQEALVAELKTSNIPEVRVFTSDPLDAASIPCIGINKINLQEDGNSNGIGRVSRPPTWDPETNLYTRYTGAYMQEAVEVRIFHTNSDKRDELGILTLSVMYAIRDALEQQGLANMTLSGGRDEQDNTLLGDRVLFMNTVVMNYLNPLDVTVTTTVEAVEGITVSPTTP